MYARGRFSVFRPLALLRETDRVVVSGPRIVGVKLGEAFHARDIARQLSDLATLHLTQEHVWPGITGIQVTSFEEALRRLVVIAMCIPGSGQTEQHALRARKQAAAFGEDFRRLRGRPMH